MTLPVYIPPEMGRVLLNCVLFFLWTLVGAQTPVQYYNGVPYNQQQYITYAWRSPAQTSLQPFTVAQSNQKNYASKQSFEIPYAPGVKEAIMGTTNQKVFSPVQSQFSTKTVTNNKSGAKRKVVKVVKSKNTNNAGKGTVGSQKVSTQKPLKDKMATQPQKGKKGNRYRVVSVKNKGTFKKSGSTKTSQKQGNKWQYTFVQPAFLGFRQEQQQSGYSQPQQPGNLQPQPGYPQPQQPQTGYPSGLQPQQPETTQLQPQPGYPQPQQPGYPQPQPVNPPWTYPLQPQPGYPQQPQQPLQPQQPQPGYPQQPQQPQPGYPQQPQQPQPGYPQQPQQPQPGYPQQPQQPQPQQPNQPQQPQPGYPQQPQQPQPGYPQQPQQPQPQQPNQPQQPLRPQQPQPAYPQQPQQPQPGYPQQPQQPQPQQPNQPQQPLQPQQPQPGYPQQPQVIYPQPGYPQEPQQPQLPQPGYPSEPQPELPPSEEGTDGLGGDSEGGILEPPENEINEGGTDESEVPEEGEGELGSENQEGQEEGEGGPGEEISNGNEIDSQGGNGEEPSTANSSCKRSRGQFASPNSCNKFLNCWDDVAIEQDCGGSLLFNEERGYCDYPQNVDCGDRAVEKPDPLPETASECPTPYGTYRSSTNCGAFIVCVDRRPHNFVCPAGLAYNDDLGVCDYDYRVDCKGVPLLPPTEEEGGENGEQPEGQGESESELGGSEPGPEEQPQGGQESLPEGTGEQNPNGQEGQTGQQPGGYPSGGLPAPGYPRLSARCRPGFVTRLARDCRTVALCVQGQTRVVSCPAGYGFNSRTGTCLYASQARCV